MSRLIVITIDTDGSIGTESIDPSIYIEPKCVSGGMCVADADWNYSMYEYESQPPNPLATELNKLGFGGEVYGKVVLKKRLGFNYIDAEIQDVHAMLKRVRQSWRFCSII